MTAQVKMYSTRFCPYCIRARTLLESKGVAYTDIGVDGDPQLRSEMMSLSGRRTVPQIWIDDLHVGGFDDLVALEREVYPQPWSEGVFRDELSLANRSYFVVEEQGAVPDLRRWSRAAPLGPGGTGPGNVLRDQS